MKIRIGFVSNSSSSNFIVDNSYKTVFDLAKAMITIRDNDYDDYDDLDSVDRSGFLTEIHDINRAIREGRDPDSSITFDTINYETFIKKVEGCYLVTTCNNHSFRHSLEGIISCPSKIYSWLHMKGYLTDDNDSYLPFTEEIDSWAFQCGEVFWLAKYDLEVYRYDYIGDYKKGNKSAEGYCNNGEHFRDFMILASTREIICPVCYTDEREKNAPEIEDRFDILDFGDKDE